VPEKKTSRAKAHVVLTAYRTKSISLLRDEMAMVRIRLRFRFDLVKNHNAVYIDCFVCLDKLIKFLFFSFVCYRIFFSFWWNKDFQNRSVRISFCSDELNRHQSKAGRGDARVVDERAARDRSDIVSWENKQSNNWRLFSAVFSPPRGALWCANVEAPFSRPTPSHAVPCTWKSPPATRSVFTSILFIGRAGENFGSVYNASSSASWPPTRRCWKHSVGVDWRRTLFLSCGPISRQSKNKLDVARKSLTWIWSLQLYACTDMY